MAYADTVDLAEYLGVAEAALPVSSTEADRLLARAGELIDYACLQRIDTSKSRLADAVRQACCQQVEYWIDNGEGIGVEGEIAEKQVGKTRIKYKSADSRELAPRASRTLQLAGLLYRGGSVA